MKLFFLKLLSPILLLLFTVSCDELNQNAFSSILDPAFVSINSLRPKFIMNVQPNLPIQGDCKAITGGVQIIGNKKTLIEVPCIENTFRATIPSSDLSVGFWRFRAEVMDYPKKNGDLKKAYSRTYQVEIEQDTTPPTINIISPLIGTSINTANESSLLVSGTCSESGRAVSLSHGTGSLTCNSRGFSGNIDFSSLADGIISLTASQTDLAGNMGTSSPVTLTKDTTPPTVNITSPVTGTEINTTNASSFLVSGICSEGGGGRVTLSHGAGSLTCNSGNFSGNIDFSAVSDGSFSLTASQTDLAGNTGTSSAVNLTKDTGLPTVAITSPVTGSSINTANESSLLVSGTCSESGRTVSLSHGTGSLTCNSGTFSGNINFSAVSDGSFSLTASQTDSLGNIGTSSAVSLTKDTGLPTVTITSPVTGTSINTTNESSLLVSGTCSESGRTVTLSHGSGSLTCNGGNFSGNVDFSSLSDGTFSLTASQTDSLGNIGTSSAVNLTKDTGLPTVTIASPVTGTSINTTNESSLLVSGTCSESGRAVSLSHGTGSLTCNGGNFSGNVDFSSLSDGTFSLTASQTDLAGNTGTSSAVNLTKDTGLPTVTITSPVTGTTINSTNESSLLVSGTCSESGRAVSLSHGTGTLTCNGGNFSSNIDFSAVSDGSFSLTASQTDASNNTATSSAVNLTKDTGLPTVTITSPVTGTSINTTNESSLLVSGTCSESGRAVSLSHGTGSLTCNGGNFSGNIDFSAVSDGTFSLTASQTDASNNTATSSAVSLTKDTGLPTVTITSPITGSSINAANESSLLVSGTCSESGRTVSLSHGSGSLTCNGGNFSGNVDFSSLSDGTFSLTASQTDASNNTATSSAVNLTKDTGLPTVAITSPSSGTSINAANESSLLVSGTCSESGRTVSLSHGTGSLTCNGGNFSGNVDFSSLSDGSFSLTASQTDSLGNIGTSSAVNLTKDTGLPTVTITSPVAGTSINTTNESSLLVRGTCSESGRTVSLSHGVGYLICNSSNSFSGNINFSTVSDGSFSLTASQTDASNNTATSSAVSLTKDTGLPTVTITSPVTGTSINTTNESSLLVSGTCSESGRTVSLSHGTGTLTCNGGNFSGNIDFSSLSDGTFSLTASQTDASNNTATSSAVNLTKDTGLPTVTITSPSTGSSINAANESSLLVNGTCSESGRAVSLSHGTGSLTCNGGNFSGNINFSAVSDGTFSLTASQTDSLGNIGTSSAVNLTKDTGLPTVTITSPSSGSSINTTNESSLLVSGTCSESGRTVNLSHGTGSLTCNGGNFSGNINFSAVSDGTFSLTASQTDASNNTATSSAVSLTKDTGLPTVAITSPVTGTSINTANESSLLVSGTCSESGRTVSLSHGSGSLTCNGGNFSGNVDFSSLSDGSFSLTASQTDSLGNIGTSSAVNLTKDTGLPTVAITSPVTGTSINTTNESSLLVSGTCSESGRTVSLSHGTGSLTCNSSNSFSGNINFSTLSDGTFSLTASQTDASNNTGTSSAVNLTKDTGLPTVTITSPVTGTSINTANESSLLVSGTCSENGRTVSLSHGTGTLTCNGGNFSGNINFSTVSDGSFSLTASQTDASNNTGTSSAVNLTKNTIVLPTVTISSPVTGTTINSTNESSLLVSGTCSESGRAVSLSHGTGTLTCNGGNFSGNINFSALSDGTFSLTASQTNASNNTGTSSAVNLIKFTEAPTVTITSPVADTLINTTNESSLLVSGTCSEDGRTVSLSHGTGYLTCNSSNNFSGNINFSTVSDGSFSLTASQTSALGNIGTSSAVSLTKDTALPTVTISSPVTGTTINTTNESSLLVSGTCSENGRTVSLSHGTGTLTCNGGNFSGNINFSALSDGTFSLTASQTNASNNTGTSSAVSLTKSTVVLPTVTITSPVADTLINTTNESSLLVSGTCSENGRAVTLSHGSGSLTCNSDSFSGNIDFSSLADGTISLTASQTDADGNTGTSSAVSLTKDTRILPVVTLLLPSEHIPINTTNASSLFVRGTCSERGRVSLSHGTGILNCRHDDTFFGFIDFSSIADGTISLTASQTNAEGHTGTSNALNLTKDTTPPTVTIASPVTGSAIITTNESSLPVSGTCSENGRTVSLSHGVGTLTCNAGNFSGNINFSSLEDGMISLTASQTDSASNTGTSSAVNLTKNTRPIIVTLTSPATGSAINATNASNLAVSGACSENGLTVSLSHGTGTLTCSSGSFSGNIDFRAVADGTFSLTASQTDVFGNIGTSSAVSLTKDTRVPTVAITSPTTGTSITSEANLLVSGTCSEDGRAVTLSHGLGSLTCNSGSFSGSVSFSPLSDGVISLTASQTDSAGNRGTSSSMSLTKNSRPTTVTITSPTTGSAINTTNESSVLVTGTCSEGGRAVSLSHGTGSLTCNQSGQFSGRINFSALSDGTFSLTASQTDFLGNIGTSSSVRLTKDTRVPTVTITSPVSGSEIDAANVSSFLVEGTCSERGRTVSLSHGTGSLTCNSGSFSGRIDFSDVSDGDILLTASQTDRADNTATSNAVSLTKDTGEPIVTLTGPANNTSISTTNASSLSVSGTCSENGQAVSLSHGTGTLTCNGGSFSGNIDLRAVADGDILLTASQTNSLGNTGTSNSVSLTKDATPPTVTIASPVTGSAISATNESSLLVSGTCSESGRTVSLSHGTGSLTCNSGNFSGNIDFSSLSDGAISLTASQTDAFGNIGTSSAVSLTKRTGGTMTSVWRISRSNEQVELPLKSGFSYNFRVNWGDGSAESTVTSYNDTDKTHTYASSGDYTITITGVVEAWGANSPSLPYQNQIIEVSDLGDMGWKDLSFAFFRCTNLTAVSGGNTANVTNMNSLFLYATLVNPSVRNWDTSKVTDMFGVFAHTSSANPDVSNWDTSKVTTMTGMFASASAANPDVSRWDTSKVTKMNSMFSTARVANPDVSNWDTSKATTMTSMFTDTSAANPDVSNWDTSKATTMSSMFARATAANPDVSRWDTSQVTNMSGMFSGATAADPDVSNFDFTSLRTINTASYFGYFIHNSRISKLNYSKLLINLDSQVIHESVIESTQKRAFTSPAKYIDATNVRDARARLMSDGWVIRDGGPDQICYTTVITGSYERCESTTNFQDEERRTCRTVYIRSRVQTTCSPRADVE